MASKWSLTSTLSPQWFSKLLSSQIHCYTFSPRLPGGPASPGNPSDPCVKRKQTFTCMVSILAHGQQLSSNRAEPISSSQRTPCVSKCTCGKVRAAWVKLAQPWQEDACISANQLQIATARREIALISSQYYPTNLDLPLSSILHC